MLSPSGNHPFQHAAESVRLPQPCNLSPYNYCYLQLIQQTCPPQWRKPHPALAVLMRSNQQTPTMLHSWFDVLEIVVSCFIIIFVFIHYCNAL